MKSKHKVKFESLYWQLREIKIKKLQKALIGKLTFFSKVTVQNKAIISTNINVAALIAKKGNHLHT